MGASCCPGAVVRKPLESFFSEEILVKPEVVSQHRLVSQHPAALGQLVGNLLKVSSQGKSHEAQGGFTARG